MKFLLILFLGFVPASNYVKIYACLTDKDDYDKLMTQVDKKENSDWCVVLRDCDHAELVIKKVEASGYDTFFVGTEEVCQRK